MDLYSFRQTQTALTAFWLVKNGFSLAYETPVVGPPWSIPFEFPIYQYIVALISDSTKFSLDATGRLVSFLFLALCLVPVRSITRQLNFSSSVFYIFSALLFSSPLYLYWGRTFMIETTAVFFSLVAIKYFIDIVQGGNSIKHSALFFIFIILGILQKATTGLPILAILGLVYFYFSINELFLKIKQKNFPSKGFYFSKIASAFFYFGIPLIIGIFWTLYTDQVKSLNGIGKNLTSAALSTWNWGSWGQRFSSDLYVGVIWKKIFEQNLSGLLGIAILTCALLSNVKKSVKKVIFTALLMGFFPLFLFTNLHIVHTYYQTANVIFLIYAIAVSIDDMLNNYCNKKILTLFLIAIMVISNYSWFSIAYLPAIKQEFNKNNSREFAIAEILKKEIPEEKYFIAFGNDWSSSLAYLAERKSFTVPEFFSKYEEISLNPENFIEENILGGVVLCPFEGRPDINQLSRWSSMNRNWKIGEVNGCYISIPETQPLIKTENISPVQCNGNIDFAGEPFPGNHNIFSVFGWTTMSEEKEYLPEKIYVTLNKKNSKNIYFEALQVSRPDANYSFDKSNYRDSKFSRLINVSNLSGEYVVGLARLNKGELETCQFKKYVSINGDVINQ